MYNVIYFIMLLITAALHNIYDKNYNTMTSKKMFTPPIWGFDEFTHIFRLFLSVGVYFGHLVGIKAM